MKKIYEIKDLKEMLNKEEYKDRFDRYVIYVEIVSVAKSGMSRQMRFYLKNRITEDEIEITESVAKLLKKKLTTKNAIRIEGVGMDMAWHTVSTILLELGIITQETFYSVKWCYQDYDYIYR